VPRLAAPFVAVVLAAALLAGCGGSSVTTDETDEAQTPLPGNAPVGASAKSCDTYATDAESLRATEIPCDQARQVMYGWQREHTCAVPNAASRGSCLTRSYRCQAVRTDRGLAVSCSRSGESIAFIVKHG
jgi:hypothetical protein